MSYYVYSTLTNDQHYADYELSDDPNALPQIKSKIFIKGGNGMSDKHFITPRGVVTEVTDEEFSILEKNPEFNRHKKNGFIKVEQREYAPDKIVRDMEVKDKSAPLTPDDYAERIPVMPGSEEVERPKAKVGKKAA